MRPKTFPMATLRAIALLSLAAGGAQAQTEPSTGRKVEKTASEVAVTPFKDVGVVKDKIPQVLLDARAATYALPAPLTCKTLFNAVDALDAELAPDLDNAETRVKSGMSAGEIGKTVVRGLMPMRAWVRKLSGAEQNDNEVRQAVLAGSVRRGYLKGVGLQLGCKPPAAPLGVTLPAAAKARKR